MTSLNGIVVGGSLAGLMTAIALDRAGVEVTLFEKKARMPDTSGGLGAELLSRTDNEMAAFLKSFYTEKGDRGLASYGHIGRSWQGLYQRYLSYLEEETAVDLQFDSRVTGAGQDQEQAWVKVDDELSYADLLIGADGHRSIVRGQVDPAKPDATFAGYLNWLGIIPEAVLPESVWQVETIMGYEYVLQGSGKILIGFMMPGDDGSTEPGKRNVMFGQYDARSNDIARRLGALEGDKAMFSVQGSALTEEEIEGLQTRAIQEPWPEPFQSAMLYAFENRDFTGILLKEYVPDQLANGRIAIVGDAAHVATSWTGMGFNASLQDAAVIGQLIKDQEPTSNEIPMILQAYEDARIQAVRSIVKGGQNFSRSFREE